MVGDADGRATGRRPRAPLRSLGGGAPGFKIGMANCLAANDFSAALR